MANTLELNVRSILTIQPNRKKFENIIRGNNTWTGGILHDPSRDALIKFFNDNIKEFAKLDDFFTYTIWKELNPTIDDAKFKELTIQEEEEWTVNAQEWVEREYPETKQTRDGWTGITEIDYNYRKNLEVLVIKRIVKDKDTKTKGTFSLEGNLDLSIFPNLKVLDLSGHDNLGKVDISKNKKLTQFYFNLPAEKFNSSSLPVINCGDNADAFPDWKICVMWHAKGSMFNDVIKELSLRMKSSDEDRRAKAFDIYIFSDTNPNSLLWTIKWETFTEHRASAKSYLANSIRSIFEEFAGKVDKETYQREIGQYRRFLDLVGGVSGTKMTTYDEGVGAGDLMFSWELFKILDDTSNYYKIEQSWEAFARRLNSIIGLSNEPPKEAVDGFRCVYCYECFQTEPTGNCPKCLRDDGFRVAKIPGSTLSTKETKTPRQEFLSKYFDDIPEKEGEIIKMLTNLRNTIWATVYNDEEWNKFAKGMDPIIQERDKYWQLSLGLYCEEPKNIEEKQNQKKERKLIKMPRIPRKRSKEEIDKDRSNKDEYAYEIASLRNLIGEASKKNILGMDVEKLMKQIGIKS